MLWTANAIYQNMVISLDMMELIGFLILFKLTCGVGRTETTVFPIKFTGACNAHSWAFNRRDIDLFFSCQRVFTRFRSRQSTI